MTPSYGYLGASWANQAKQNRASDQSNAQFWQQWAPDRNRYIQQTNQYNAQRSMRAGDQRSQAMRFGLNALAGLMR